VEWRNKAEAIASYAKQADDETLFNHATRIKARAIRRGGELLRAIEPTKGGRPPKNGTTLDGKTPGGAPRSFFCPVCKDWFYERASGIVRRVPTTTPIASAAIAIG